MCKKAGQPLWLAFFEQAAAIFMFEILLGCLR